MEGYTTDKYDRLLSRTMEVASLLYKEGDGNMLTSSPEMYIILIDNGIMGDDLKEIVSSTFLDIDEYLKYIDICVGECRGDRSLTKFSIQKRYISSLSSSLFIKDRKESMISFKRALAFATINRAY